MQRINTALITGASSGIGQALAIALSRPGATIHLAGRDQRRLEATALACRERGAAAHTRVIDVCDAAAMAKWINGIGHLDLVIANAGIGAGSEDGRPETANQVRVVLTTNLDGALNTMLPALDRMLLQPPDSRGLRGRIVAIASIAAFVPAPNAASYAASKAALDVWTVATAHNAARHGVQLTSICPGYIRTAMTAKNRFPMPGIMASDKAATLILRAVMAGRRRYAFPWWIAGLARLIGALPPTWSARILAAAPGKAPLQR